jgi:hypothetical protein
MQGDECTGFPGDEVFEYNGFDCRLSYNGVFDPFLQTGRTVKCYSIVGVFVSSFNWFGSFLYVFSNSKIGSFQSISCFILNS